EDNCHSVKDLLGKELRVIISNHICSAGREACRRIPSSQPQAVSSNRFTSLPLIRRCKAAPEVITLEHIQKGGETDPRVHFSPDRVHRAHTQSHSSPMVKCVQLTGTRGGTPACCSQPG
ncbi:hypothetical protein STEG23_013261, partial [Scotinomys teguina]